METDDEDLSYSESDKNESDEDTEYNYDSEADFPEEETEDIYNQHENLRAMQENLSNLIAENRITHEEYENEMLRTNYYIDVNTKTYVLTDEDNIIIQRTRSRKASLIESYKSLEISEEEFYNEYNKLIRLEYSIMKMSETPDNVGKREYLFEHINLRIEPKLELLHKAEAAHRKSVAKKVGLSYPIKPTGITYDEIHQYNKNVQLNVYQPFRKIIADYLQEYASYKQYVDYNTSSFEISQRIFKDETYTTDTPGTNYSYTFKVIKPLNNKLSKIKHDLKKTSLLLPDEQRYSDKISNLVMKMRELSRVELLSCISARTFKHMSYVERLKENKQRMFKFKNHPVDNQELKRILNDVLGVYKISVVLLFREYVYSLPDISLGEDDRNDKIENYLETGKIGYLAIKEGVNRLDLGDDLKNFVTVKPMNDELFIELQKIKNDNPSLNYQNEETSIIDVWELRFSLSQIMGDKPSKKNIIKRYVSFKDYITDLKDILITNYNKLPNTSKTSGVLREKIKKIDYYLKTGEDPELYTQTGHTSVSDLFKDRLIIYNNRKQGIVLLTSLIAKYYQHSSHSISNLENDIFNFSSIQSNYNNNILKIIFILQNYQDKLEDFINGEISGLELLIFETPMITPDDDGFDLLQDKQASITYLLNWAPNTDDYISYKKDLEDMEYNIEKFKKTYTELTNLHINNILSQYSEHLQWSRCLEDYNNLKLPAGGVNENNFRLRYLLKNRNKLPSRRIYRIVDIKTRILTQEEITRVFEKCKITRPDDYSRITETIIYNLSKGPGDYDYYKKLIKEEYTNICKYFSAAKILCIDDEFQDTDNCIAYDANIISPIITEFIITQGRFSEVDSPPKTRLSDTPLFNVISNLIKMSPTITLKEIRNELIEHYSEITWSSDDISDIINMLKDNIESGKRSFRLAQFARNANSVYMLKYIKELRGFDIEAYDNIITGEINSKESKNITLEDKRFLKAIRRARSIKILKQLDDHQTLINNKYIAPTISSQKPSIIAMGNEHITEYIKINDFYIYGGFYPEYMRYYLDKNKEPTPNYTRVDLEKLAGYFNVSIVDDLPELLKTIIDTKNSYNNPSITIIPKIYEPVENNYYEYLKSPVKNVIYTIRPRLGVKEPGEVYPVVKDLQKMYGVPFNYTSSNIPIYSSELKQLADNSFIVIEGPCIFQDTEDGVITSDSYILIEYTDSRGKVKLFREGVSKKKIIIKDITTIDTCSRFLNEYSCNDINSRSLEIQGLKFKCKWLNEKCSGVLIETDIVSEFNISTIKFTDSKLNKLWNDAVEISLNYIENLVKIKELNEDEIKILTTDQKPRLYNYYTYLMKLNLNDESLTNEETIAVKSYTMLDMIGTNLEINPKTIRPEIINSDYKNITIYHSMETTMKYPIPNIKLGKEYNINDTIVIPDEYTEEGYLICHHPGSDDKIIYRPGEFRQTTNKTVIKSFPVFCIISNDDYRLLKDFPGYYWYIDVDEYDETVKDMVVFKKKIKNVKKTFIPTCFISTTNILNGKHLITRTDIINAINRTAFNKLTTSDEYIYEIVQKVDATVAAIDFSVKKMLNLNELSTRIIGTIDLEDVINEDNNINPTKSLTTTKNELIEKLSRAIETTDLQTIKENYVIAKKNRLPKDILSQAKLIIDGQNKLEPENPEQTVEPEISLPIKSFRNLYVSSGRR